MLGIKIFGLLIVLMGIAGLLFSQMAYGAIGELSWGMGIIGALAGSAIFNLARQLDRATKRIDLLEGNQ